MNSVQSGNAASLAVVQKAGAQALSLSLDFPGYPTQMPECKYGPGLTPMSTCDPTSPWQPRPIECPMSPGFAFSGTSPYSPGLSVSINSAGLSSSINSTGLTFATMPQQAYFSAPVATAPPSLAAVAPQQIRTQPWPMSPMSPCTPGAQIRRNAASFGIPLNVQPVVGEVGVPIPVRTTAGKVFCPSPTAASSASALSGFAPPAEAPVVAGMRPAQVLSGFNLTAMPGNIPTAGDRPFVTPFSAGLRVGTGRKGGIGGA